MKYDIERKDGAIVGVNGKKVVETTYSKDEYTPEELEGIIKLAKHYARENSCESLAENAIYAWTTYYKLEDGSYFAYCYTDEDMFDLYVIDAYAGGATKSDAFVKLNNVLADDLYEQLKEDYSDWMGWEETKASLNEWLNY